MPRAPKAPPPPEFEGVEGDPPDPVDMSGWLNDHAADFVPLTGIAPVELGPEHQTFKPRGMIDIRGAAYLPARRRVQWLRGDDIVPHPEWSIETEIFNFSVGEFKGTKRVGGQTVPDVQGGWAIVRATVSRAEGDHDIIVGQGTAIEWSEMFPDFFEKAETSAIARALAIAGYGTEGATDLDEGNIADSPVATGSILINGSALSGVGLGGSQSLITEVQYQRVRELAREKALDPLTMKIAIESVIDQPEEAKLLTADFPDAGTADQMREFVLAVLRDLKFEEAGALIRLLELSDEPASP